MSNDYELFTAIDDSSIENIVNDSLTENLSETLYSGDERRIYANAIILLLCTVFTYLNESAKMRLLRFAKGEILDYLGERVNCSRLEPSKATATERYSLSNELNISVTIPKGSTVTPDGVLIFETTESAVIPAGETYVDVPIQSQDGGSMYNDYAIGTINTQVSNVPFISSVENITSTSGGDDGEPYPLSDDHPEGDDGAGDDSYRERIKKAPAAFSTAGPEEAYEYFALSADTSIEDVKVTSDQEAGRVDITVTTTGGNVPTAAVLEKVKEACSDKTVRPLNDDVYVNSPELVYYDIELCYYVTVEDEDTAVKAIEGDGGAIDSFISWQSSKISRDINPDKLTALLVEAGAKRAVITSPIYTKLDVSTNPVGVGELACFSGNLTVTHEIEEE